MINPADWLDNLQVVLSPNRGSRSALPPRVIVVHTMESSERTGAALSSAMWHASGNTIGSAHIHVDDKTTIRGVYDSERSNGAAGANDRGLHVECAGRAGQTPEEWADPFSVAVVDRAAHIVASWCVRFGIPAVKIGPSDLRSGKSGICGHVDVSNAFGQSTHWDPGPNFPWDQFMSRVQTLIKPQQGENEIMLIPHPTNAGGPNKPRCLKLYAQDRRIVGFNGAALKGSKKAGTLSVLQLSKEPLGWFQGAGGNVNVMYADGTATRHEWDD